MGIGCLAQVRAKAHRGDSGKTRIAKAQQTRNDSKGNHLGTDEEDAVHILCGNLHVHHLRHHERDEELERRLGKGAYCRNEESAAVGLQGSAHDLEIVCSCALGCPVGSGFSRHHAPPSSPGMRSCRGYARAPSQASAAPLP